MKRASAEARAGEIALGDRGRGAQAIEAIIHEREFKLSGTGDTGQIASPVLVGTEVAEPSRVSG